MADGKIYITISDTRGGSGAGVGEGAGTQNDRKENAVGKYVQHRFFNFIESQAKQAVNYTISNIGNFTGNYQAQRDTEELLKGVSIAINIGASIAAGAKMGGWVGAIIGGIISIGSEAISFGYRERSEQFQNKKTNRNIEMMRRRLGLEGLTDGSRTGGY